MAKTSVVPKKKRGPPPTGKGTQIGMRWQDDLLSAIDIWREKHEVVTRPDAIRRLVEIGLEVKTPARPVSKPGRRLRAQELAAKAIEKIIDPAAPLEARTERKRRLTKGPSEFRETRVDQPKPKR